MWYKLFFLCLYFTYPDSYTFVYTVDYDDADWTGAARPVELQVWMHCWSGHCWEAAGMCCHSLIILVTWLQPSTHTDLLCCNHFAQYSPLPQACFPSLPRMFCNSATQQISLIVDIVTAVISPWVLLTSNAMVREEKNAGNRVGTGLRCSFEVSLFALHAGRKVVVGLRPTMTLPCSCFH